MNINRLVQNSRPMVYRIIYTSTITIPGGPEMIAAEVRNIVSWSREWNANVGITGTLLVDNANFSQILEGPARAVKSLFGHINLDWRNNDILLLESGFVEEKAFEEWSMAYVGTAGAADYRVPVEQLVLLNGTLNDRAKAVMRLMQGVLAQKRSGMLSR